MKEFVPRPYKLFNKIQNYEWGGRGAGAFIPKFLGVPAENGKPYAELWIGAHPKAPSEIEVGDRRVGLDAVIAARGPEALGEYVMKKFDGKLPFLLKVLSAAHALSIQTHPNKSQAVRLHAADPEHYPDDNHKPEIAIALDSLSALVGFKPAAQIAQSLRGLPELKEFVDKPLYEKAVSAGPGPALDNAMKNVYSDIMRKSGNTEKLSPCIREIRAGLAAKDTRSQAETQFLKQYELYGDDVGLLSFFFFNMVTLKPGEAIFTDAGVPHAYIEGNIVECMANSDNVVRAGLTPKFKDVTTLLDIVRFEFAAGSIIVPEKKGGANIYKSKAEEFQINRLSEAGNFRRVCKSNDRPRICLVAAGELEVLWSYAGKDCLKSFSRGESFFIPAFLPEFRLSSTEGVDCFMVEIP